MKILSTNISLPKKIIFNNKTLITSIFKEPTDKVLKVKEIGLQKGENLHERLIMDGPLSSEYERYTVSEIYDMI